MCYARGSFCKGERLTVVQTPGPCCCWTVRNVFSVLRLFLGHADWNSALTILPGEYTASTSFSTLPKEEPAAAKLVNDTNSEFRPCFLTMYAQLHILPQHTYLELLCYSDESLSLSLACLALIHKLYSHSFCKLSILWKDRKAHINIGICQQVRLNLINWEWENCSYIPGGAKSRTMPGNRESCLLMRLGGLGPSITASSLIISSASWTNSYMNVHAEYNVVKRLSRKGDLILLQLLSENIILYPSSVMKN